MIHDNLYRRVHNVRRIDELQQTYAEKIRNFYLKEKFSGENLETITDLSTGW